MATGTIRTSAPTPASPPVPHAATLAGSPLVRLLARLSGPETPMGQDAPLAEVVGKWLHWTDAAALHEVLDGSPAASATPGAAPDVDELARAVQRERDAITRAILADCAALGGEADSDDPRAWRRMLVNRLQSMQGSLAPVRERLRGALTAGSPAWARLARVDAVMERSLGVQERALLGALVPSILQRHADRLRATAPTPDAWRGPFGRELQAVLMAALDLCLQPLEGLLAALRTAASTDRSR